MNFARKITGVVWVRHLASDPHEGVVHLVWALTLPLLVLLYAAIACANVPSWFPTTAGFGSAIGPGSTFTIANSRPGSFAAIVSSPAESARIARASWSAKSRSAGSHRY